MLTVAWGAGRMSGDAAGTNLIAALLTESMSRSGRSASYGLKHSLPRGSFECRRRCGSATLGRTRPGGPARRVGAYCTAVD